MGNTQQRRISAKISRGAALMLVVVFGFGAVTTQSAQAQTLRVLYKTSPARPAAEIPTQV
jgi:hypothetical protein